MTGAELSFTTAHESRSDRKLLHQSVGRFHRDVGQLFESHGSANLDARSPSFEADVDRILVNLCETMRVRISPLVRVFRILILLVFLALIRV